MPIPFWTVYNQWFYVKKNRCLGHPDYSWRPINPCQLWLYIAGQPESRGGTPSVEDRDRQQGASRTNPSGCQRETSAWNIGLWGHGSYPNKLSRPALTFNLWVSLQADRYTTEQAQDLTASRSYPVSRSLPDPPRVVSIIKRLADNQ
jgi:hypothetical protein